MSRKKYAKFICPGCGKNAKREKKYINSAKKWNKPLFCSQSCAATTINKNRPKEFYKYMAKNFGGKTKLDEYSPFRNYIERMKRHPGNATIYDLKLLWEKQNGLCNWSKLPMKMYPCCGTKLKNKISIFELASIDRIDSTKPYNKDNIQFVIASLNFAKNSATDLEFRKFLQLLKQ